MIDHMMDHNAEWWITIMNDGSHHGSQYWMIDHMMDHNNEW